MNKQSVISQAIKVIREEGIRAFLKKASVYIFDVFKEALVLPYALLKIKNLSQNCSVNELCSLAFNGLGGVIKPSQVYSEISELLKILDSMALKAILEVGTERGGTLFLFSRVASKHAVIISIDLPGGDFGGGYPIWRKFLYKSFASASQKIHLLRADSHAEETLEAVKAILNGREIDFLFIDGDHTYAGVKKDFEMYRPLVKKNGTVAFHDIVPGPQELVGGVPELWKEVKESYHSKEIVKDWKQVGYGIGLLLLE